MAALKEKMAALKFSRGSPKQDTRLHRVKFLNVVSGLQVFLGCLCVCLALVGVIAAFQIREYNAITANRELQYQMREFYSYHIRNLTTLALDVRKQLVRYFIYKMDGMRQDNCSDTGPIDPPQTIIKPCYGGYRLIHAKVDKKTADYSEEEEEDEYRCNINYCLNHECDPAARLNQYFLIIDYLGVPGWTGFMLIITGLVGLRMAHFWQKLDYLQVSHSYNFLNLLIAILFGPLMVAVGVVQIVLSRIVLFNRWEPLFRHELGIVNVSFAGFIWIMAIIISLINCCCPIKPDIGFYEKPSEVLIPVETEKEKNGEFDA